MKIIEQRNQLEKRCKKAKTIFIMAHHDLDLDALGSSIGFYFILEKMNKNCYLIIDDKRNELGVSKILKELDGCISIIQGNTIKEYLYPRMNRNLLLILDTNKTELVQNSTVLEYFDEDHRIIIDHHDKGESSIPCDLEIIDQEVSSTCEMVANLMESYRMKIDPYYSTLVLSGIVLDTNNFTLKTTEETYYAAYYLTNQGASPKKVQYLLKQDLKEYIERQKLMLNVDILHKTIAISKGSAYTIYRREDLAKIADTLLFFNDVETTFVIGKIGEKTIGISARSSGKINVGNLLAQFHGGGDEYGAAARIEDSTITKVTANLTKLLKEMEGE